jgi:hypothetical protein
MRVTARGFRKRLATAVAATAALSLFVALDSASGAGTWERPDLTVKLHAGDVVELVPPGGGASGGGTAAPVYSAVTGRSLGNFVTDIQGAPDVFSLLGTALATGTSRAATVDLTIELGRGTLRERHTANLAVLAEPPSTGYEFVVAVVGEGVVLPGTGIYEHASGTSSLLLVFEVDAESQLPPVVRTGTLRFDID